jgi:hypothetical protein
MEEIMTWTCPVCRKPILADSDVIQVLTVHVTIGQKSGQTVLVPNSDKPDHLHPECVPKYFDPQWNEDVLESVRGRLKDEIREEVKQELYEEVLDQVLSDSERLCPNCREELGEE